MLRRIFGYLGSIASIISLGFYYNNNTAVSIIAILGIGAVIYLIYDEIIKNQNNKMFLCNNDGEIKQYMLNWISTPGKVSIFSRDLSWVDDKIKILMLSKKEDLSICAAKETDLLKELRENNANIYLYDDSMSPMVSKFTIIRANKSDKQIAVATTQKIHGKEKHCIYESKNNLLDHWILGLAQDLIHMTKQLSNNEKRNENEH